MKILLFGKNGQVGWELQRALAPLGELIALSTHSTDFHADFAEPEALAATVRAVAPTWIVNAAAYTAVDKAESEPALARAINATAPGVLAREAATLGATLLHYSTDYVFDGSGSTPWLEDAATGPLGVYGATKLEGEEAVRRSGCAHLILRTSWVYAARGGNFVKTMLRLAQERDALKVIDDQIGAPTGAELLADVSAHALRHSTRQPQANGTYHVAAAGQTSWHAYALHVIERARMQGRTIRVAREAIEAVPTRAFPTPAKRPGNSRLDTRKFQDTFDLRLPAWETGVDRLLAEVLA